MFRRDHPASTLPLAKYFKINCMPTIQILTTDIQYQTGYACGLWPLSLNHIAFRTAIHLLRPVTPSKVFRRCEIPPLPASSGPAAAETAAAKATSESSGRTETATAETA